MRRIILTTCLVCLSGCATTSFAPPIVDLKRELEAKRYQTTVNAVCTPTPIDRTGKRHIIRQNVDGALALIDNYVLTYRCQRDRAAEGRQYFEVPAMLATIGGATAAAFGAPPGVAIGTGAASAAFGQGKSYYAPKDKAKVLSDGLKAMLCIQNAAIGVDPFTLRQLSAAQGEGAADTDTDTNTGTDTPATALAALTTSHPGGGGQVELSYGRTYFKMIRSALFGVEDVVAERLSAAGSPFDAAGVIAEIEKLNKKEADEKAASDKKDPTTTGNEAKTAAGATGAHSMAFALESLRNVPAAQVGRTVIKLDELQTKLDKCIINAKV